MEKKNILIACSSLDYILIYKILCNHFIITRAESCEEILNLGEVGHFHILLVDVSFLKPDFEVLYFAKKKRIPVIALSSEPYDARDKEMRIAGCCACYVKPIRQEIFGPFVQYWLKQCSCN